MSTRIVPLLAAVAGFMALLLPTAGFGQSAWKPERAVEIVVGTAAGSAPDRTARLIQDILRTKKLLSVPTTVMNRAGGGGALGWAFLNQHPGDGHYIMIAAGNLSVAHLTGASTISFRDLTTIAMLFHDYVVMSVRADSPIKDGRDLLERLKKDPASASLAVSSVSGSATHIAAVLALKNGGVEIRKVRTIVFDSLGKSFSAVLGGHVDVAAGSLTQSLAQARAGKVRIIGYSAPRRLGGELAAIATWREQGSDMEFSNYRGIVGPRGMSAPQINYWENVFAELDKDDNWRADVERNHMDREFMGSEAMKKYLEKLAVPIRSVLDELGLVK